MNKQPFINAFLALVYIAGVVSLMNYATHHMPEKGTFLQPIAFLSLLTLSASVMGYIFAFQPLRLYIDGKKKEAVNLFLQTVGVFAVITCIIFLIVMFTSFR